MLDSHAHVLFRDTVAFPPKVSDLQTKAFLSENAFEPSHLCAEMDRCGVDRALIVQRGQFYGADNSFVCDAALASGGRLRAIAGIDSCAPDCARAAREWLDRGASGLRIMGRPAERSLDWLGGEPAEALWRLCADRGVVMACHLFPVVRSAGLQMISELLDRYPLRALVIDHLSNPAIESPQHAGIDDALRLLAERESVTLKFTTIPLGGLAAKGIDAGSVIGAYVDLVGVDRLMWGSDITQSPGTYSELVDLAHSATRDFPEDVRTKLLGDNACRIYEWY